jgi:hypothetical protein
MMHEGADSRAIMADSLRNSAAALRSRQTIDLPRVFFTIGMMLLVLTVFMFPPAITDIVARNEDWKVFAASAFARFATIRRNTAVQPSPTRSSDS